MTLRCNVVFLCAAFLAAGTFSQTANAQVLYGSVVGIAEDPSGGGVPGATVTITNRATGQTHEAKTDGEGRYLIGNVLPGLALEAVRVSRGASAYLLQAAPLRLATADVRIPIAPDGLLRVLPFDFRGDFGPEMEEVFREQRTFASGPRAVFARHTFRGERAAVLFLEHALLGRLPTPHARARRKDALFTLANLCYRLGDSHPRVA